jgi:hypothetical protein
MQAAWLAENNSTDWPTALQFIQFRKKCTFHSGDNSINIYK